MSKLSSVQTNGEQKSVWSFRALSNVSSRTNSSNGTRSAKSDDIPRLRSDKRKPGGHWPICLKCFIVGVLIGAIALAVLLTVWLKSGSASNGNGSKATSSTSRPTTTSTTATSSTSSSSTSTSSTSSSTSTSTTSTTTSSTTSTTTSSTTSTTTSSTTSTTTSSTTSITTSSTTSTATTTTATTSTTTSTTSSATTTTASTTTSTSVSTSTSTSTSSVSTSTSTTATTSSTTTSGYDTCLTPRWNQTGVMVAGTGSSGSGLNQFKDPTWLYIDTNDTIYVSDHHNARIQMWLKGATNGTTLVDANVDGEHPLSFTFDKNGFLYAAGHRTNRVLRYGYGSSVGTTVAGKNNVNSAALDCLSDPLGLDLDDDLNLYIADKSNARIMKWAPNATTGTLLIGTGSTPEPHGLLLSLYSSNAVYFSSQTANAVYLWTFGAPLPTLTLTQVNATTSTLSSPAGMAYDTYGNLYVVDNNNRRVVMFCTNSTIGRVVVNSGTPALGSPEAVAFDSNLNLYIVDQNRQAVFRYNKLN